MWYEIASSTSALLVPLLPVLRKIGAGIADQAVEAIGQKLDKDTWSKIQNIWQIISPKIRSDSQTEKSVSRFASDIEKNANNIPQVDYAFRSLLEVILTEDEELGRKVAAAIKEVEKKENNGAAISIQSQIAKNIINATTIVNLHVE